MPSPGGTTRMFPNAGAPQRRKAKRSALRLNSSAMVARGASGCRPLDDDRMIDDEIERHAVELLRIAAEPDHRVAHRGQVAEQRYARGVVHHHARRTKPDFALGAARPSHTGTAAMSRAIRASAALPQQVFKHDFERVGQPRHSYKPDSSAAARL